MHNLTALGTRSHHRPACPQSIADSVAIVDDEPHIRETAPRRHDFFNVFSWSNRASCIPFVALWRCGHCRHPRSKDELLTIEQPPNGQLPNVT